MRNKLDLPDKFRKRLHPLLLKGVEGRIDIPIKVLNSMPEVQGNKLFAINHSCVLDFPVFNEAVKEHVYPLVGKQSLEIIDRIFFFLNGVVYVDRKNKKNKKKSLRRCIRKQKSISISNYTNK